MSKNIKETFRVIEHNLVAIAALRSDEQAGCSREHLDSLLKEIDVTRQDLQHFLYPETLQEEGGSKMLMA